MQETVYEVAAPGVVEEEGFAQEAFAAEAEAFGEAAGGGVSGSMKAVRRCRARRQKQ